MTGLLHLGAECVGVELDQKIAEDTIEMLKDLKERGAF